jgi:hypothetical protein
VNPEEITKVRSLDPATRADLLGQARRAVERAYPELRLTWNDGILIIAAPSEWVEALGGAEGQTHG